MTARDDFGFCGSARPTAARDPVVGGRRRAAFTTDISDAAAILTPRACLRGTCLCRVVIVALVQGATVAMACRLWFARSVVCCRIALIGGTVDGEDAKELEAWGLW